MATCQVCGVNQAGFMSEMCSACIDARRPSMDSSRAAIPLSDTAESRAGSEGETASYIGNAVIWLSLVASAICIFTFGRVTVPDALGGTQTAWSSLAVAIFAGAGLNGVFFGYVLAKIGSVLKHLERLRKAGNEA